MRPILVPLELAVRAATSALPGDYPSPAAFDAARWDMVLFRRGRANLAHLMGLPVPKGTAAATFLLPARTYDRCEACGGPLPYGGHVATPLCDGCLNGEIADLCGFVDEGPVS